MYQRLQTVLHKIDPQDIANAFLYSLSTRRLEYRSALGSYYFAKAILSCVDKPEPKDKIGKLRSLITNEKLLRSNKDEVKVLLGELGICGVLAGNDYPSYDVFFADEYQRDPTEHINDFAYPVNRRYARDGVNTEKLKEVLRYEYRRLFRTAQISNNRLYISSAVKEPPDLHDAVDNNIEHRIVIDVDPISGIILSGRNESVSGGFICHRTAHVKRRRRG